MHQLCVFVRKLNKRTGDNFRLYPFRGIVFESATFLGNTFFCRTFSRRKATEQMDEPFFESDQSKLDGQSQVGKMHQTEFEFEFESIYIY